MTTMVWAHLAYLAICIGVTIWVAGTLKKFGPIFMSNAESDPSPLVKAKTHLLVVGFYLINLGLIGFALRFGGHAVDAQSAIELLSTKIGVIVVGIGFMHFVMVASFGAARKSGILDAKAATRPTV